MTYDNCSTIREQERHAEEQTYCNLCGNIAFAGVCEKCWDEMFVPPKREIKKERKRRINWN